MTPFFASLWLEHARIALQCGWFALFGAALWASVAALHRPRAARLFEIARTLWAVAMGVWVSGWMAGATLELMRRAAGVSGSGLVVALGAFSVLLAGVLSLVREWFGARWSDALRGEALALSLVVFTLAGWWFGGHCLIQNPLWSLSGDPDARPRLPDGWALSLGGATLFGASHLAASRDESVWRVRNPRAVSLWILVTALFLGLPVLGDNPRAASVFLAGAGAFAVKMWRARRDRPLVLRVNAATRAVLVIWVAALPFWGVNPALWAAPVAQNWREPGYSWAFSVFVAGVLALGIGSREPLRLAVFDFFWRRALLVGAGVGTLAATLEFGPAGALFWAFWPLAGLFFDLLSPRVQHFSAAPNAAAPSSADSVSAGS